jgi:YesN/AraC family two-component response regulator
MPEQSGLELVEWVKAHSPDTECIFLTCHNEFDFARQAVHLQALEYILKPATAEALEAGLRKAITLIEKKRRTDDYAHYGRRFVKELAVPTAEEEDRRREEAVARVERYIEEHIAEEISIEDLASVAYLSGDYLTRVFKKLRGKTLMEHLTDERLRLAKRLLEDSDLNITLIASRVGYESYNYFSTVFKRRCGMTPGEWRRRKSRR